ncbi:MAG: hypothetical protein AB1726_10570 [Planctomycetota bacterium]
MEHADPALAPLAEELARSVLPPLFARVREAGTSLERLLGALAARGEGWTGDEELLAGAEALGGRDRQLGWALGVVAAAMGVDLLGARRERDGVRLLVELVAEGAGFRLVPEATALLRPARRMGEGWELPLAVAIFFLRAARGSPEGVLRWCLERSAGGRVLACPDVPPLAAAGPAWSPLLARIPGAALVADAPHPALYLPETWIDPTRTTNERER